MSGVGILAYGQSIEDPGTEIEAAIVGRGAGAESGVLWAEYVEVSLLVLGDRRSAA